MVYCIYHKDFQKDYAKLQDHIRVRFALRLALFQNNPSHPLLKDHQLQGGLEGRRAFSVTGDIRVVYRYVGKNVALLLRIGSHNQVY